MELSVVVYRDIAVSPNMAHFIHDPKFLDLSGGSNAAIIFSCANSSDGIATVLCQDLD